MDRILFPLSACLMAAAACSGPPVRTGYIGADSAQLFVRTLGNGRDTVVVLHHGPGLHGEYLVRALAPLAEGRTFLIYDQRGRGRSQPLADTASLSLAGDVADLDHLRRSLGLERMRLLGHGWGGVIAVSYALEHPAAVDRLLLVSPWFPRLLHVWGIRTFAYESTDSVGLAGLDAARLRHLDVTDPVRFCQQYWGAWLSPADIRDPAVLRALRDPMCDAPAEALARVEAVNRAVMRTIGAWDIRERLDSVAAVTLLVQGLGTRPDSDSTAAFVWRTAAYEWTERLPRGGVVFLRAPAQFPWLGDRDAFDQVVGTFLGGGWPADALAPRSRIASER